MNRLRLFSANATGRHLFDPLQEQRYRCRVCQTEYFRPLAECDYCPGETPTAYAERRASESDAQALRLQIEADARASWRAS